MVKRDSIELDADASGKALRLDVVELGGDARACWLIVFTDTSRQRAELRRRDRFLAMLAHELRNPLGAISTAANVLRMTEHERTGRSREVCDVVLNQVRHMARMVDDLLDVSRYVHGKIKLDLAAVDLADVVARSLDTLRPTIEGKRHKVTFGRPVGPLLVRGDTVRLTQVVTNLLHNAAKYTPAGGRIEIVAEATLGFGRLRIGDNGIGMTGEELALAFQPFEQAKQGLERSESGLGLGLALVKMAVELHGGTVAIASDGVGTGCRVDLALPAAKKAARPAPPRAASPTPSAEKRVLVVEDDANIRNGMRMLLKASGYKVRTAADGIDGIEAFKAWSPAAVILDIGLPGKDGFEVAAEIRRTAGAAGPTLIAVTGYAQP